MYLRAKLVVAAEGTAVEVGTAEAVAEGAAVEVGTAEVVVGEVVAVEVVVVVQCEGTK